MNYSTLLLPPVQLGENLTDAQMTRTSLYEALQGLADPRRGAGKCYPLPVVLCLLCLAKMAGQTTLKGARLRGCGCALKRWLPPLDSSERRCPAR